MGSSSQEVDKKILERGYWVATHRIAIQRLSIVGLYIAIAVAFAVFFVQFGLYMYRVSELGILAAHSVAQLYDWEAIHARSAPTELEVGDVFVFARGENAYDIVAQISNPNEEWAISSIDYEFSSPQNEALGGGTAFALPGETKYLFSLNRDSATPIVSASLTINHVEWQRMTESPPLAWEFTSAPVFIGRRLVVRGGVQTEIPPQVSWSVRNNSTYNVRSVEWQIAFFSGDRLAGLMKYQSENVGFLDELDIQIFVTGAVGRVTRVEVIPSVDIFDPDFFYLRAPGSS